LVANCFLGAFPPVDLRAVCFVRAKSLLGRSFRRHQLVCYSCQVSHHHAQRHPASTKNARRTCLNCELLFTFTLTALFRATHIFQKESRLLLHKSTLTHIFFRIYFRGPNPYVLTLRPFFP
jgi:hypothetical protein